MTKNPNPNKMKGGDMKLIGYIWSMNIFALQRGEAVDVQPACDVEDKDGYIPIYIDEED